MENSKDKTFFWIGTFFLCSALLVLTIIPKFFLDFIPYIYINSYRFRSMATGLFLLALASYFISKSTYKKQIAAISTGFIYYLIFIKLFAG